MMLCMKYVSLTAAIDTLKRFFADPHADIVTLEDIYAATKRDLTKEEKNRAWIGNKLTHLKHYGLVRPIYSYGSQKVLEKVQLTDEGKKALQRSGDSKLNLRSVSLEGIAQDIREFEKQNPSIKLDLSVKIKEGLIEQS
jgi:hypothetical protein